MAGPTTINGEQLLIMISDGASPEVFSHPCLINTTRGFSLDMDVTQETIPDCDDPDAPAWKSVEVDGLSMTITGAGVHDIASSAEYFAWATSGANKNVKVKQNKAGGSIYSGAFKLTAYAEDGAARKGKVTVALTLVSDGPVTRADNS
ncbi:MAG: hypothetical protein GC145_06235 [Caulobacter sp.]|nr:hypothetical protein [Caulobacter sp.]